MNHELDRLGEPFPVLPGVTIPVGEYAMTSASVRFSSNQSRRFFASVDMEGGSFFGGDEQEYGGEVFYKFSKHLSVGANIERNEFSLPAWTSIRPRRSSASVSLPQPGGNCSRTG